MRRSILSIMATCKTCIQEHARLGLHSLQHNAHQHTDNHVAGEDAPRNGELADNVAARTAHERQHDKLNAQQDEKRRKDPGFVGVKGHGDEPWPVADTVWGVTIEAHDRRSAKHLVSRHEEEEG